MTAAGGEEAGPAPTQIRDEKELALLCARLAAGEPVFSRLLDSHGPPPLWRRENEFEALARLILEQQVSLESARRRLEALRAALGALSPAAVAAAGVAGLRKLGVTGQKAEYLAGAAGSVLAGGIELQALSVASDREAIDRLLSIRGVGPWTASVYLVLVLSRTDVWPSGDLALLRSFRETFGERCEDQAHLTRRAKSWRPYRSVAARMLWHSYLRLRGRW
jgi:DNA-3-methyladenine glycosylase II